MSAQNTINPITVEIFHSKFDRTCINEVVYPLGTMKVCTTFYGNLSKRCWDTSVWMNIDRLTSWLLDVTIPRATRAASVAQKLAIQLGVTNKQKNQCWQQTAPLIQFALERWLNWQEWMDDWNNDASCLNSIIIYVTAQSWWKMIWAGDIW